LVLFIITIGASFAYFTANIEGAETGTTITTTGGTLNIFHAGGKNIYCKEIIQLD